MGCKEAMIISKSNKKHVSDSAHQNKYAYLNQQDVTSSNQTVHLRMPKPRLIVLTIFVNKQLADTDLAYFLAMHRNCIGGGGKQKEF